jgi:hypothetical protein
MDEAVQARAAARAAVDDIEPPELADALDGLLAEASMAPGTLALLTARAVDPEADLSALAERAAGVQLIYDGLRITRLLAHTEPWTGVAEADIEADLDVLAAVVLVSRGFYILARTPAAERAVGVVRQFGRDQTLRSREDADREALDRNLEAAVFELAVAVGATAVGGAATPELLSFARDQCATVEGELPDAEALFAGGLVSELAALSQRGDDPVPSVADDG